ncbi:MAG: ABC transporter ATP-binding protein [Candidatus Eisenbacteria bacterium]
MRPHRGLFALGLALMLVAVASDLLGPIVLRRLIDRDISAHSASGIMHSAALYLGLFLVGTIAGYFQVVVLTRMGLAVVTELKRRVFRHLLGLSLAYFDKNPPGKLLARVESDSERLQALFSEVGIAILRTSILVLGTIAVMLATDWRITVTILALAAPIVAGTIFFFRWMRGLYRRVRGLYARISTFVAEYVQGVPILQMYGYERRAAERLARLNDDKLVAERNAALYEYGFFGLLTAIEVCAVIVILFIGSGKIFGFVISVGTLVLFIEYTRRVFWPLAMFSEQINFLQKAFASADRVFGVLDTPSRTPDRPGARQAIPEDWREVAFENVSFAYDSGTRALDSISFRIRRGEKVAVVGWSGGGKTTITNLLLRFYEPTEGTITLDGVDIRDYTQKAWRSKLGLVLQDIHLFPGTVAENLRAMNEPVRAGGGAQCPDDEDGNGGPPATAGGDGSGGAMVGEGEGDGEGDGDGNGDRIAKAIRIVGAEELIARLPKGLDEPLAEGGANLSMGERQLLSFARAIVSDPDLLVLDEATSSVDPATERRLQRSLDRLLAGRTSLIIAHRLATIVSADRILVLHGGRLVEEGSHEELYAKDGIYRDLFDLQFRSGAIAS